MRQDTTTVCPGRSATALKAIDQPRRISENSSSAFVYAIAQTDSKPKGQVTAGSPVHPRTAAQDRAVAPELQAVKRLKTVNFWRFKNRRGAPAKV